MIIVFPIKVKDKFMILLVFHSCCLFTTIIAFLIIQLSGCVSVQERDHEKEAKIYGLGYYQGNFYIGYAHEKIIYIDVNRAGNNNRLCAE